MGVKVYDRHTSKDNLCFLYKDGHKEQINYMLPENMIGGFSNYNLYFANTKKGNYVIYERIIMKSPSPSDIETEYSFYFRSGDKGEELTECKDIVGVIKDGETND